MLPALLVPRCSSALSSGDFPVGTLTPLASARSAGKSLKFKGEDVAVKELTPESFEGVEIALFSAGGGISKEFAQHAVAAGAVVIDNSSAFRMDENVPLVVPEVNPAAAKAHQGIIANPNCTTIVTLMGLAPLHREWGRRERDRVELPGGLRQWRAGDRGTRVAGEGDCRWG